MRDYTELVKALRTCKMSIPCTECPFYSNGDEPSKECATMNVSAADAIEELLKEKAELDNSGKLLVEAFDLAKEKLQKYRHAAFVISETCVDESKSHISPEDAIKKIRKHIYYDSTASCSDALEEVV